MKINSRKLLVLLANLRKEDQLGFSSEQAAYLWPELGTEGRRSLLYYLFQQKWLVKVFVGGKAKYRLSSYGEVKLRQLYSFLSEPVYEAPKEHSGHCIVFLASPKHDPQFRALRKKVLSEGATGLSKGAYLFRSGLPAIISELCERSYLHSVVIFAVKEWVIGDPFLLSHQQQDYRDAVSSLSGISREVNELIEKKLLFSTLNHQAKMDIFSVFERFFTFLDRNRVLLESDAQLRGSVQTLLRSLQDVLFR